MMAMFVPAAVMLVAGVLSLWWWRGAAWWLGARGDEAQGGSGGGRGHRRVRGRGVIVATLGFFAAAQVFFAGALVRAEMTGGIVEGAVEGGGVVGGGVGTPRWMLVLMVGGVVWCFVLAPVGAAVLQGMRVGWPKNRG